MIIMTEEDPSDKIHRSTSIYVKWIAIGVGVFMVMVGGLLLLWGFSYQATVGEPSDLEGGELTGGPVLIPMGAISITFGALWLFYGLKGFKRPGDEMGMKNCPNCGKLIEEDLNFCYHCTSTFSTPEELERIERSTENTTEDDGEEILDVDGVDHQRPSEGQIRRKMRMEERRKKADTIDGKDMADKGRKGRTGDEHEAGPEKPPRKARSLEGLNMKDKGQ
jgi:hypothetical protein